MQPEQISDYRVPSDPRMHPDGFRAAFVVARADLEENRSESRIWYWDGNEARPLTTGPFDSAPRWSPDGKRLAFLRKGPGDGDRPQIATLSLDGGEAAVVTEFSLGAREIEWSPDGTRLAAIATEWTAQWDDLEAEEREAKPRRITRIPFRFDDLGWLDDRRSHLWIVDPSGSEPPRCVTPGDCNEAQPAWNPDGSEIAFVSARYEERGFDAATQIWTVPVAGGELKAVSGLGMWELPSYDPSGRLHAVGSDGVWSYPDIYPLQRHDGDGRWTDLTGHLDRNISGFAPLTAPAGPQWLADGRAWSVLEDEGRVRVVVIAPNANVADVLGGDRVVTGVSPRSDGTAGVFVASTPNFS